MNDSLTMQSVPSSRVKLSAVFRRAIELLSPPHVWAREPQRKNETCLAVAVSRANTQLIEAAGSTDYGFMKDTLAALGFASHNQAYHWNDVPERRLEDVVQLLTNAAARCEEQGN